MNAETMMKAVCRHTGLIIAGLAASLFTAAATAQGVTMEQLENAGFVCNEHNHCLRPDNFGKKAVQVYVFSETGEFLGTETLLLGGPDGQAPPCPHQEPAQWVDISPIVGMEYYACHHFDWEVGD